MTLKNQWAKVLIFDNKMRNKLDNVNVLTNKKRRLFEPPFF